jgi:two-component system cell cycle sensor histidine kinase/response regulator CckA
MSGFLKASSSMPISPQITNNKCTILYVDDDETVLEIGVKMLEILGCSVLEARNGLEAIQVFKKHREKVKLVILDMQMPIMNGENAYFELKKINPDVKVLVATGYTENSRVKSLLSQGLDGYIRKPYTLNQLSEKIVQIIPINTLIKSNNCQ